MTTPNLSQPLLIAGVEWPANKALAVVVALAVFLAVFVVSASAQFAFALSLAGAMLVWWTVKPAGDRPAQP